jgi:hypothetical protein
MKVLYGDGLIIGIKPKMLDACRGIKRSLGIRECSLLIKLDGRLSELSSSQFICYLYVNF